MSLAELEAERDRAERECDLAEDCYQRGGNGENYREWMAAREARTKAQDAVDAGSKVPA